MPDQPPPTTATDGVMNAVWDNLLPAVIGDGRTGFRRRLRRSGIHGAGVPKHLPERATPGTGSPAETASTNSLANSMASFRSTGRPECSAT